MKTVHIIITIIVAIAFFVSIAVFAYNTVGLSDMA